MSGHKKRSNPNGTGFAGSPTAGANGDLTYLVAPGGVSISFSGRAVRHADGRQRQRIGLKPDVEVTPTLAGMANQPAVPRHEPLSWAAAYANSLPFATDAGLSDVTDRSHHWIGVF